MGEIITLTSADGTAMQAYIARDHTAQPERGMLVLQEAFGITAHIRDLADRIASAGYLAIAPEFFHRSAPAGWEGSDQNFPEVMPHMRALTADGQDADLRAAYDWLQQQGIATVAAMGFCMGGRVAVRAASLLELRAAAAFYASDLPSLRPRVPQIHCPLLLAWGDQDSHIPPAQRAEFADLLRAQRKAFVECTFSAAGHGFLRPSAPGHDPASAHIAWSFLLAFLHQHVG